MIFLLQSNGATTSQICTLQFQTLESPSECTTLSTVSTLTAGPLDQKHKYHMFFAYHPSNKEWLQELVKRLEAEPWAYKCCYADRDFDSRCTSTQNVLCSIMLSHRIVVVLTPRFIKDQWNEYEESLAHLASMTLRKQRVIPIILEETNIPDSLRMLRAVDARRKDFWDVFLQNVCLGKYSTNCEEDVGFETVSNIADFTLSTTINESMFCHVSDINITHLKFCGKYFVY